MNGTQLNTFNESAKKVAETTNVVLEKQKELQTAQQAATDAITAHEKLIPTLKTA